MVVLALLVGDFLQYWYETGIGWDYFDCWDYCDMELRKKGFGCCTDKSVCAICAIKLREYAESS